MGRRWDDSLFCVVGERISSGFCTEIFGWISGLSTCSSSSVVQIWLRFVPRHLSNRGLPITGPRGLPPDLQLDLDQDLSPFWEVNMGQVSLSCLCRANRGGCPHGLSFLPWRAEASVLVDTQRLVDLELSVVSDSRSNAESLA